MLVCLSVLLVVLLTPGTSGSSRGDPSDALAFNAVRRALTCLESRGSSRPLVAMSPQRLVQFHRFHRRLRQDPACKSGVEDCGVGRCISEPANQLQVCRCLLGFTGDRCDVYPGQCWLLHCFLEDCYSARGARLRCVCDPSLYGTRVLSGLYWYNDGLRGSYRPPPPSWIDVVPKQGGEPESYAMDGVDEEVDLTLYNEAIAAATPRTRIPSNTRGEGRRFNNKTILSFLASQMWKIEGAKMLFMKNETTKPTTTKGNLLGVAAKAAKSTLEKDFGGDDKFVYEDYSNFPEPPVLSGSSVLSPLHPAWPLLSALVYSAFNRGAFFY